MKYLAAVSAFVVVHLVFLYLFWLSGAEFERGSAIFLAGLYALILSGLATGIILATWEDKK
jgi:hypothetical protein